MHALEPGARLYFYREDGGQEIDFLIETAEGCWAYEVKASSTPSLDDARHLRALQADLKICTSQVICLVDGSISLGHGIQARSVWEMECPAVPDSD